MPTGSSAPLRPVRVVAAFASRLRINGCARCDARPRLAAGPPGRRISRSATLPHLSHVASILREMSERSMRWGVLPEYYSYRGDVVPTSPETENAILAAMGAAGDHPPRARRRAGPPATPPDRCA